MAVTDGRAPERDDAARFFAEASHELRGGAARLALMAEALAVQLAPPGRDPQTVPRLLALAAEGRRVQALASALLDVAQLAREGRRLDPVAVRVAPALDEVLAGEPTPEGHTVEVRVPDDLTVWADRLALDQILSNLVRNARQHGGPAVMVDGRIEDGMAVVTVADDGPGVPPERAADLFSPYRRGVGEGLGLCIAAQLTTLLDGDLRHEPVTPTGSRFVVRLPRAV